MSTLQIKKEAVKQLIFKVKNEDQDGTAPSVKTRCCRQRDLPGSIPGTGCERKGPWRLKKCSKKCRSDLDGFTTSESSGLDKYLPSRREVDRPSPVGGAGVRNIEHV